MPKIIKSDAVIEEKSAFMIDLPDIALSNDGNDNMTADDLDFFKNIDLLDEDKDNFEKYYTSLDGKKESTDYEKYFDDLDLTEEDFEYKKYYDEPDADSETVKEEVATDDSSESEEAQASEDEYYEPDEEEQIVHQATPEEIETQIIEAAQERAKRIIDDAKKEAETLRMKLVAEISEAEVKKELAKNIAQNTVDEANDEYEKLLASAREQAKEILEKAQNDGYELGMTQGTDDGYKKGVEKGLEEGRRTGNEKGYQEGFASGNEKGRAEGYQKAYDEMAQKLAESTKKAKDILLDAQKEKVDIVNSSDSQVIEIAMSVAKKILNKEFTDNPFSILKIVKNAARKVSDQPRLIISVSPTNYDIVKMATDDIKKTLGSKQEVSVVADNTLGIADVIVGTGGSGDVDARLETQMSEIRKTIETVIQQ